MSVLLVFLPWYLFFFSQAFLTLWVVLLVCNTSIGFLLVQGNRPGWKSVVEKTSTPRKHLQQQLASWQLHPPFLHSTSKYAQNLRQGLSDSLLYTCRESECAGITSHVFNYSPLFPMRIIDSFVFPILASSTKCFSSATCCRASGVHKDKTTL